MTLDINRVLQGAAGLEATSVQLAIIASMCLCQRSFNSRLKELFLTCFFS